MKIFYLSILTLLFLPYLYAQTKVNKQEFESEFQSNSESSAIIVVYAGQNRERLGNVLSHTRGLKTHYERMLKAKGRISSVVVAGGKIFDKEFWLIPKEAKPPIFEPISTDLKGLTEKFYYGREVIEDDSLPDFYEDSIYLVPYYKALKENPNYTALILVETGVVENSSGKRFKTTERIKDLKDSFKSFGKRAQIKLVKDDKSDGGLFTYYYLIPKSKNKTPFSITQESMLY